MNTKQKNFMQQIEDNDFILVIDLILNDESRKKLYIFSDIKEVIDDEKLRTNIIKLKIKELLDNKTLLEPPKGFILAIIESTPQSLVNNKDINDLYF